MESNEKIEEILNEYMEGALSKDSMSELVKDLEAYSKAREREAYEKGYEDGKKNFVSDGMRNILQQDKEGE